MLRRLRVDGLAIANERGVARLAGRKGSLDAAAVTALAEQITDRFPAMRAR